MAVLDTQPVGTQWSTGDQIAAYLSPAAEKSLVAAVDALVDRTVASPADTYTQS